MDSIDISRVPDAVNGFLSSLCQTGSNVGSSLANMGNSITANLPSSIIQVFPKKAPPPPPATYSQMCSAFVAEHKRAVAVTAAAVATAAGFYFVTNQRQQNTRARRSRSKHRKQLPRVARRAKDGGRSEVVLIAGSPKEALVSLIARDLDIRGFIVYITASPTEVDTVLNEKSEDIRPLRLASYFEPESVADCMQLLDKVLDTPVVSFSGAAPHSLAFAGIIIVPDLFYPSGPLEATSATQWAQTVQSKIQMPLNILAAGGIGLVRKRASKLVLISPMIIGSLAPGFHAAESTVYGALSALALSLSRELSSHHVTVTHMKLGSFDTRQLRTPSPGSSDSAPYTSPIAGASTERQVQSSMQADILSWPDGIRRLYGGQYKASAFLVTNQTRGSSLRGLYHAIYDVLESSSPPRTVHVGRGSRIYDWLTTWVPEGLMTFVLSSSANESARA